MASSRTTFASMILCALLLNLLQSHQTVGMGTSGGLISPVSPSPSPSASPINCVTECGRRCSKSSRPNRCNRACMSCCHTCSCVPPGTAGNADVCPCYASLLNPKNGVHKCP